MQAQIAEILGLARHVTSMWLGFQCKPSCRISGTTAPRQPRFSMQAQLPNFWDKVGLDVVGESVGLSIQAQLSRFWDSKAVGLREVASRLPHASPVAELLGHTMLFRDGVDAWDLSMPAQLPRFWDLLSTVSI